LAVVVPSAFDPVTVYDAWAAAAVGVPEIIPVELSRVKPVGSAGLTPYESTVPVTVGASGAMAWFTTAEIDDWL
jgi:hypothetical protein